MTALSKIYAMILGRKVKGRGRGKEECHRFKLVLERD